jgi:hypothetical protein
MEKIDALNDDIPARETCAAAGFRVTDDDSRF